MTDKSTGIPWLDYALRQVGYHEGPNNDNKFGAELNCNHEPWCDLFVACCCKNSGWPLPSMQAGISTGAAAVIDSINYAKTHGLWRPSWEAGAGFQICYGWDGPSSSPDNMHTGLILSSGPKGATGHTVEGNRSDQVERCTFTVGESVVLGTIDLPRLLLPRPTVTIHKPKPTTKLAPQPRHPKHPKNTGPTRQQTKAARRAARTIAHRWAGWHCW